MIRKKWARLSVAAAAFLLIAALPAMAQNSPPSYEFDLPAEPLGDALRALAQVSQQQIIFSEAAVRGKRSPELRGTFTVDQGLARLLDQSGLAVKRTAGGVVYIESVPSAEASGPSQPAEQAGQLAYVVVTGSRIRRTSTSTAAPVAVISGSSIEERGFTQAGQMLNEVPSNLPQFPQGPFSGVPAGSGQTFPNLFGLGAGRTLTLIDGRRMVTSGSGLDQRTIDVNVIPTGLIQRIEIDQAGGAAVYGSDAIAGVVNYILVDHFQGVAVDAQYGNTFTNDYRQPSLRLTLGRNFADDRGNIAADFEWSRTDPLLESQRPPFDMGLRSVPNPAKTSPNDGIPPTMYVYNGRLWGFNENGVVFGANSRRPSALVTSGGTPLQFSPDGSQLIPYDTGIIQGPTSTAIGGEGYPGWLLSTLQAGVKRYTGTVIGHFDFTDHMTMSNEFLYGREEGADPLGTEVFQNTAGGFGPYSAVAFTKDNPYLTPGEVATLSTANPGFAAGGPLYLSKASDILPTRNDSNITNTWREMLTLKGDFQQLNRDFDWSVSDAYGKTNATQSVWDESIDHFNNAVDAVRNGDGQIVCAINAVAVTDPGCSPLDLFGSQPALAQTQARAYISALDGSWTRNTMNDFLADFNGDLLSLPTGKARFSLAYEHRNESAAITPFPADVENLTIQSTGAPPISDSYHTNEFSGELLVPLIGGKFTLPLVHLLELHGSYRKVNHSLVGNESVWGSGLRWQVGYGLTLRATKSRNFSSPTLDELIEPATSGGNPANDPCDTTQINSGPNPAVRRANCEALFAANPGYGSLSSFYDPSESTGSVNVTFRGNPALNPEVSDTVTYGFVFQPRYVPGLSVSVDAIRIHLTNAISEFGVNDFLATCYDTSPQPAGVCGTFTRNAQGYLVTGFDEFYNAGFLIYRGEVYSGSYAFPIGRLFHGRDLGELELDVNASHTRQLETSVTGFDYSYSQGTTSMPDWVLRFDAHYLLGPVRVLYSLYYLPSVKSSYTATINSTPVPIVASNAVHSVSVEYDWRQFTFRAGVDDLNNALTSFPTRGYGNIIGAQYFLGVKARLY